jgi:hypothetical protein
MPPASPLEAVLTTPTSPLFSSPYRHPRSLELAYQTIPFSPLWLACAAYALDLTIFIVIDTYQTTVEG